MDKWEESGMVGRSSLSVKQEVDLDEVDMDDENKSVKQCCTGEQGNVCSIRLVTHCIAY